MFFFLGKLMSIGHFWPATQILTLLRCSLPTPDTLPPGWYLQCKCFEGGEVLLLSDRLADGSYSIDADPECFMVIINFLQVGWFLISSVYLYFLQYDRVILPSLGGPTIEDIGFVANQLALGPEISLQVGAAANFFSIITQPNSAMWRRKTISVFNCFSFKVEKSRGARCWREGATFDTSEATGLILIFCWNFWNETWICCWIFWN